MAVAILFLCLVYGVFSCNCSSFKPALQEENVIQEMTERMDTMESKLRQLDKLESRILHMDGIIQDQRSQLISHGRRVRRLESLLRRRFPEGTSQESFADLKTKNEFSKIRPVQIHVRGIREVSVDIKQILNPGNSSGQVYTAKAHTNYIRDVPRGTSFSAVLTHNYGHLGEHQVVVYDRVLVNDGNGYSRYTGVFTCPESGVYFFIYHMCVQGVQTWLHLMVNGQVKNTATAEAHGSLQELQGSNSAILHLTQDDRVWIEAWSASHPNTLYGRELANSFSGTLLY